MLQFMDCLLIRLALGRGIGDIKKGNASLHGRRRLAFCLPAFIERARETRKGESSPLLVRGRVLEISSSAPQKILRLL